MQFKRTPAFQNRSSLVAWFAALTLLVASTTTSRAALVCTPGNIVGAGACTESVTFGPVFGLFRALTIDKWLSNAEAGFTETLLDVKFSFSGSFIATATVTNTGSTSATKTLGWNTTILYNPGASAPANFLNPSLTVTGGLSFPISLTPGQTLNFTISGPTTTAILGPITTGLSDYIGPGTFAAVAIGQTTTSTSGSSNISSDQTLSVGAEIDVTYDFMTTGAAGVGTDGTATPIPATLPLLATGLGAFGLVARCRKRKSAAGIV